MIYILELFIAIINNPLFINFIEKFLIPIVTSLLAGFCTIGSALIAVWGVSNTINSNQELKNRELLKNQELKNQELLNSLDQKSEWRKELMNIASQTFMTTDDLYRVLASLRFQPHNDTVDIDDFKSMTKKIYDELNDMLDKKYNSQIKQKLSEKTCFKSKDYTIYIEFIDSEIIRLYTKYLLKHHWEINIDENKWLEEQKEVIEEVKGLRNKIK
ncbi:hypothetical protein PZM47_08610 [Staphylococcus epidermidis]|nr:hypothetical protein [Staphylococcus epidermidis]